MADRALENKTEYLKNKGIDEEAFSRQEEIFKYNERDILRGDGFATVPYPGPSFPAGIITVTLPFNRTSAEINVDSMAVMGLSVRGVRE